MKKSIQLFKMLCCLTLSLFSAGCHNGNSMVKSREQVKDDIHIYIADQEHSQILQMEDMKGKNLIRFGMRNNLGHSDPGTGQFDLIDAMFVDSAGHIFIIDAGNERLCRMDDMQGSNWKVLTEDHHGHSLKGVQLPDIYVDKTGKIYLLSVDIGMHTSTQDFLKLQQKLKSSPQDSFKKLLDRNNGAIIRVDDMNGSNWTVFSGVKDRYFSFPGGIFVDNQQRIYVADTGHDRIVRMDDMTGKNWITFAPGLQSPTTVVVR